MVDHTHKGDQTKGTMFIYKGGVLNDHTNGKDDFIINLIAWFVCVCVIIIENDCKCDHSVCIQ